MRDPILRFLSEYKYQYFVLHEQDPEKGTTLSLNDWAQKMREEVEMNPFYKDCHFVKQKEFVSECHYVIDFANLDTELVYVVSLHRIEPKKLLKNNVSKPKRGDVSVLDNVSKSDLSAENLEFWTQFYAEDIALYNHLRTFTIFDRPSGAQLVKYCSQHH